MLRAFILFMILQAFLLVLPATSPLNAAYAKTKPAPYGAQKWREKKGAITNSDRERLAKFTAYLGGRPKGNDGRTEAAASLSIKGDSVFNKHLEDNRLELLDSIDNDTGLQVSLVRDKDTGRVFVLPRGTEFGHEKINDGAKADLGGFYTGQLKIGKAQYESGKAKIASWIKKYKGNVEVIGHSLGGAIAQRIFLDNAENISSVTVFNSPGLELDTVNNALSKPSLLKKMMNPDGSRKMNIFNVKNDIVGSGGGIMVPGNVVMAEGGDLSKGGNPLTVWLNAHTKLIFGPDVKREPMDYYRYQSWRDRSGFLAEDVTKDIARAIFNITNFKSPVKNELRDLLGRLTDYENAILRQVDRKKRDKWRKSKEKKRNKDKKPDPDKIVTAVIDKTQLDIEQGRKPPTGKKTKKKVVKKPKKEKPKIKKNVPKPAAQDLGVPGTSILQGTFSFPLSLSSEIDKTTWGDPATGRGTVKLTINGPEVTGTITAESNLKLPWLNTVMSGSIQGVHHRDGRIAVLSHVSWQATDMARCLRMASNSAGCSGKDSVSIVAKRVGNQFIGTYNAMGLFGKWTASAVPMPLPQSQVDSFDNAFEARVQHLGEVGDDPKFIIAYTWPEFD